VKIAKDYIRSKMTFDIDNAKKVCGCD